MTTVAEVHETVHAINARQREDDARFIAHLNRQRDHILLCPLLNNPFLHRSEVAKRVIASVGGLYGFGPEEITGRARTQRISKARFVIYRLLTDWGYSSAQIGRLVGGRDHTTVLHGLGQFDIHSVRDQFMAAIYERHRRAMRRAVEAIAA
ncbi:helix-turn-helix domain-containing protein [Alteraurantiacibacter buctensis]|uniref:Chromosomal replication initiator DnaA C-terminal domain-containing protein n=1 Tax=Alteraurantiacibacter buctensis TaxID=1503981 RepID=A0A844Z0L7_9SPHN|nr:helix-turn-helix domain-containing protein [Alteraurantiacibacter buctensis]MXO72888.1 hypothetical protein [Alteraurantiacibacter buctensis]